MKPVRWREGMFLRPQHFQQQDLYHESRETWTRALADPSWWGIQSLEIEESQLDNFTIAARSLRAVFPGGALVDVPANTRLASREFGAAFKDTGRPLDVFVGVRRREERISQSESETQDARFTAVDEEAFDIETGRDPVSIETLRYNARFFLGDEPTHGFETLPVARLNRTGNPSRPVELDKRFAPPCLVLSGSPVLLQATRSVVDRLVLAMREMREKGIGTDPLRPIVLQAVGAAIPVLRDMAEEGLVPPRLVHRELSRLAGALLLRKETTRTEDDIPPYDHAAPAPAFERLASLIYELVEWEIVEQFAIVEMKRSGDLFTTDLVPEHRRPGQRLFLEVLANESAPRLRNLLMTAKISSAARIEFLKGYVLPGVASEPQPGPPPELPSRPPAAYFRLKIDEGEEYARNVVSAGDLAAWILNAPADVRMNLVVIFPKR
ncbi:MAG: type VI secretion system baseplate subunit TssK [Acidobacteria bacterium]|nr:type VI secretion system baseplate subunit TssK [Acidobacteriota bacterium]